MTAAIRWWPSFPSRDGRTSELPEKARPSVRLVCVGDNIGTDAGLENWAYNLDSNEWHRLEFTPFGPARKPLKCMSNHLICALSKNRIPMVRQYDETHRRKDEELDNLVLLYDLVHMAVHPLSTLSLSHNLRSPKENIACPLYGLGTHWFHCGICYEITRGVF